MTGPTGRRLALALAASSCLCLVAADAALACSLPIDPVVAIVMRGKNNYDGVGGKPNSFLVHEDVDVSWDAYWDPIEQFNAAGVVGNGGEVAAAIRTALQTLGAPATTFQGRDLYNLPNFVTAMQGGTLTIEQAQLALLNLDWRKDPLSPVDVGGNVAGAVISVDVTGVSEIKSSITAPADVPKAGDSVQSTQQASWTVYVEDEGWDGTGGAWILKNWDVFWTTDLVGEVWLGNQPATATGTTLTVKYPTPTEPLARIHLMADMSTTYEYQSQGSAFKWNEVTRDAAGVEKDRRGPLTASYRGSVSRSRGTKLSPFYDAWVMVTDDSGPLHFSVSPTSQAVFVGKAPTDEVTVKVLENNPYTSEMPQAPMGMFYYSTQLCDWEHEPGEVLLHEANAGMHPSPKFCDCQAYHKERWVWRTTPLTYVGAEQVLEGAKKAYSILTFTAAPMEPVPWHYANGSLGYTHLGATYLPYQDDRIKYFAVASDAKGQAGAVCSFTDMALDPSASDPAATSNDYVVAGGAGTLAKPDQLKPATNVLLGKIAASGEDAAKWGKYGTVDVTDDAFPSVRVFITDTKYNRTFMYGHNDSLDGTVAGYRTAWGGGAGSSNTNADSPYKGVHPAAGPWIFDANGNDGGYQIQQDLIGLGEFGPAQNIVGGPAYGFWCDEDTRLLFKVQCRDNINQWSSTPVAFTYNLDDPGKAASDSLQSIGGDSWEYTFRDPNRGRNAVVRDCTFTVTATDAVGKATTLTIFIFVASNDLVLQTLEENRRRQ